MVRGTTVFDDGAITVEPGHGEFLSSQDDHGRESLETHTAATAAA
jgi:hypothetical protein